MDEAQFATLENSVAAAAQHACQALLAMESLRHSTDPQHQAAYHGIHDLIGDLGTLLFQLDLMAREPGSTKPPWKPVPSPASPVHTRGSGVSS